MWKCFSGRISVPFLHTMFSQRIEHEKWNTDVFDCTHHKCIYNVHTETVRENSWTRVFQLILNNCVLDIGKLMKYLVWTSSESKFRGGGIWHQIIYSKIWIERVRLGPNRNAISPELLQPLCLEYVKCIRIKLKFIDFIRPIGRCKARVWSEIKPLFKSIEGFSNSIQATLKRPSHSLYLSLPSKRCTESLPRLAPIFLFLIRFSLDCVHIHECLFTISFSMYRLFSRIVQFPCSKCSVHCNVWFVVSRSLSLSLSRCVY